MKKTAKVELFAHIRQNWTEYYQMNQIEENAEHGKCLYAKLKESMDILQMLDMTNEYKRWNIEQNNYNIHGNYLFGFLKQHGLYTIGTNEDYINLLKIINKCNKKIVIGIVGIEQITQNIFDHSGYLDGMNVQDLQNMLISNNNIVTITY